MEFTQIFSGMALLLVVIIAFGSMTGAWNAEYGSAVGADTEFNTTVTHVTNILETGFTNASFEYANSTQAQSGAGTSDNQNDNLLSRAFKTIGLIDDLIGLVPAVMRDGGNALNIDERYTNIAINLFWIVFAIVLAYLLILGVSKFLGR